MQNKVIFNLLYLLVEKRANFVTQVNGALFGRVLKYILHEMESSGIIALVKIINQVLNLGTRGIH
jgi:hypothetical protein